MIHPLGLGKDHDEILMNNFANLKKGNYYNIENGDQIADVFANCLAGLMSVVAKDIYITIGAVNPY
jgi:hypothetical protein